ncbi:hypothetical protein PanWU01x14_263720, partial [Parasponia andersonii]
LRPALGFLEAPLIFFLIVGQVKPAHDSRHHPEGLFFRARSLDLFSLLSPGSVWSRPSFIVLHVLPEPACVDCQHDLGIEIAAVNGVVPEVSVELAVPIPILHMFRDAGLGRVLENAPVPVLETLKAGIISAYLCDLVPQAQDGLMGPLRLSVCFCQGGEHLIQLLSQVRSFLSGAPFGIRTGTPGRHS